MKFKLLCFILLFSSTSFADVTLEQSEIEKHFIDFRYTNTTELNDILYAESDELHIDGISEDTYSSKKKSPGKAFVMSLFVPGLGQYYNGNKVKSALFVGAEVTSWLIHFKLQGDGDDLTNAYEDFNNTHWSEARYDSLILWTYGAIDDDSVDVMFQEINHHLPDTKTQQYYEMTGKYDQFVWGWDDANLNGLMFDDFGPVPNEFPRLNSPDNIPVSANRLTYETMRNDANNKYDAARRWIYVSMINHLFSAFDALFSAKKINKQGTETDDSILSRVSLNTKLKSYHDFKDTPYITCKIMF